MSLKNRIRKKLKSEAGESIAEVLIALLIAALALTMLASVISSSANIINNSKKKLSDYYAANEELSAEKQAATGSKISKATDVTFTLKDKNGVAHSLSRKSSLVTTYTNSQLSNTQVIAYAFQETATVSGGGAP